MKKFNAMSNPTIDLFLLQEGVCLKPEDFAEEVAETVRPRSRTKDHFLAQERAKSRRERTANLKNTRVKKSWDSLELQERKGKDIQYYDWRVFGEGTVEDPYRLGIWKITERKDKRGIRRALESSAVKLAEER